MKALLIGGTGTISLSISRQLLELGWELFLLNRGSHNDLLAPGATILQANIHDEAAVAALLEGQFFDVVVDFIAYTPDDVERDARLFAGITRQYIFVSSASAYQKPLSSYLISESTPLANPYWAYSRDKIACEEFLMGLYRETGFPVTIVRPSHTYDQRTVPVGVHGQNGCWQVLHRMLTGKPILIHGDGTSLWTFTHAQDFAAGFIGLMGNIHAIGEAVHITSDETLTWDQAHALIADALGVELLALHVPSFFLAQCGEGAGYDYRGSLLGDKANSVVFDNSKIKRLVPGFGPCKRFDEGVRESVAYFLSQPELQQEDPAFDLFCDRIVDAMTGALVVACDEQ